MTEPTGGTPAATQTTPLPDRKFPKHVQALFDFFVSRYAPAEMGPDVIKKTTVEIYEEMQMHCPSVDYTQETVYLFLSENGFSYATPGGDMDFCWVMKYKQIPAAVNANEA